MELVSPVDWAKQSVATVQDYVFLALRSIANIFAHPRYVTDTLQQMDMIGVGSVPVVVLTGMMVAGRNASGMASELGSMKVTEQIDAMRALGTDPTKKLVTPRVIASVFMLFFLTIISDLVGLVGGWVISAFLLRIDSAQYWSYAWQSLGFADVIQGLVKPVLFGFVIASVGCYYGLSAKGGTQGVGRATTQAVVAASVLILAVDLVLTRFLMIVFPGR